nr:TetR/AcrR family transcriptional regulator [uncultured Nocardioides sp.]
MTIDAPRRGRPTAQQRDERRRRMLDRALPMFLEHGYDRTTVEQLARSAGVTKRTIYSDYGDKAGLFVAMVSRLAAEVSDASASESDTLAGLAARIVFRTHSDDLVGLHRLVIAEAERFPDLARTFHELADQRHIERLAHYVHDEPGRHSAAVAEALFSQLLGAAHRRRLLGVTDAPTMSEAVDLATDALDKLGLT